MTIPSSHIFTVSFALTAASAAPCRNASSATLSAVFAVTKGLAPSCTDTTSHSHEVCLTAFTADSKRVAPPVMIFIGLSVFMFSLTSSLILSVLSSLAAIIISSALLSTNRSMLYSITALPQSRAVILSKPILLPLPAASIIALVNIPLLLKTWTNISILRKFLLLPICFCIITNTTHKFLYSPQA